MQTRYQLLRFTCIAVLILAGTSPSPAVTLGMLQSENNSKEVQTDAQDAKLIELLASSDDEQATRAVKEIFARGERMIPWLLKHKNDRRCYEGAQLGRGRGGNYKAIPIDKDCGKYIHDLETIEIVCLYLISAIYHGELGFANTSTLRKVDKQAIDPIYKKEMVSCAWKATEEWATAFAKEGMVSLRTKQHDPLSGSGVVFYGTRVSK